MSSFPSSPTITEIEFLKKRSREFLEEYEDALRGGRYSLAVFFLEQALQLYLKARLLEEGASYPRTHNIRALIRLLARVKDDNKLLELLDKYSLELSTLEDAYITVRCFFKEFSRNDAIKLKSIVEKVLEIV